MLLAVVRPRLLARGKPIVYMAPVIRRELRRFHAERFHRVDCLECPLHLGPAVEAQQNFATRANGGQRLLDLAPADRAHDIDAGDDHAEVIGGPAHKRKHAAGSECQDAPSPVDNGISVMTPEANPMLDAAFEPGQFGLRQRWSAVGSGALASDRVVMSAGFR
jgi:hypothetical protein